MAARRPSKLRGANVLLVFSPSWVWQETLCCPVVPFSHSLVQGSLIKYPQKRVHLLLGPIWLLGSQVGLSSDGLGESESRRGSPEQHKRMESERDSGFRV